MTKKQVLFWRVILIIFILVGGFFIARNLVMRRLEMKENIGEKIIKVEDEKAKKIPKEQDEEVKFNIRKPDFYKGE